jgi:hypothetical protein
MKGCETVYMQERERSLKGFLKFAFGTFLIVAIGMTCSLWSNYYIPKCLTEEYLLKNIAYEERVKPTAIPTQTTDYAAEIQNLKKEIELLKTSRGDYTREQFKKEKVIQAIDNNLGGLLNGKGAVFYDAGQQNNVNPMLMAAISVHETASGNSKVLRECNNVAGINWTSNNEPHIGRYRVFSSIDDSIYNLAYLLNNYYIQQGRTTIDSIGRKFCPLDDIDNGKYGMSNESWIPNVTKIYQKILKEAV